MQPVSVTFSYRDKDRLWVARRGRRDSPEETPVEGVGVTKERAFADLLKGLLEAGILTYKEHRWSARTATVE